MVKSETLRVVVPSVEAEPATQQRTVLLVLQNQRLLRSVTRVMRASHYDIITTQEAASAPTWLERGGVDLVICDYELVRHRGAEGRAALQQLSDHPAAAPLILICEDPTRGELAELLDQPFAVNLVAKLGTPLDNGELLATARKIMENDFFGIEKYLRWGSVIHKYEMSGSEQKEEILGQLERFLVELGCRRRLMGQLLTVADELMTNGLFNAPLDAAGRFMYTHRTRSEAVVLPFAKALEVQFGCDGRALAICCRDPFGSLEPRQVRKTLSRCLRTDRLKVRPAPGGAGLGLYMVFEYMTHLVVNIAPGIVTEVLGVIDITQSAKQRCNQPRALSIFVQHPRTGGELQ